MLPFDTVALAKAGAELTGSAEGSCTAPEIVVASIVIIHQARAKAEAALCRDILIAYPHPKDMDPTGNIWAGKNCA
jgi:hypothetical protein